MSGSAHPTTSAGGPSAEQLIYEMRRACGAAPPVECLSMTLGDGRTILDEIDALTARLAVWEQLRPDIETLLANRPTQCPHYGCDSTKARNWRIDCSDDQCLNPAHTRYERCTSTWHDQTEAADRITRTLKEQQP